MIVFLLGNVLSLIMYILLALAMAECNTVQEAPPDNSNSSLRAHINRDTSLVYNRVAALGLIF